MLPQNRILEVKDKKYFVLSIQPIGKGLIIKKLKKQWNANTVLKNQGNYWICQDIINAEFEDINEII